MNEADQLGLTGGERAFYAGKKAVIEGGITWLMGRFGEKLGLTTMEETLSPGMRNATQQFVQKSGIVEKIKSLAKGVGGATMEAAEEAFIDVMHQGNELDAGSKQKFDWERLLESGAAGLAGAGAAKTIQQIGKTLNRSPQTLQDTVAGVKAAEIALRAADAKQTEQGRVSTEAPAPTTASDTDVAGEANTAAAIATLRTDADRAAFERIAAFKVESRGKTGARGMNAALAFLDNVTPEQLESLRKPLDQKQFAEITGIKKTSAAFRDSFRETLDVYAGVGKSTEATTPSETESQPTATEPTVEQQSVEPIAEPTVEPQPQPTPSQSPDPNLSAPWEQRSRWQAKFETQYLRNRALREKIATMRVDYRQSRQFREQQLSDAVKLVRENLPSREAGKLIEAIRDARTPATIESLFDRVEAAANKVEHRTAKAQLIDTLKAARNLRPEWADVVDGIRNTIDTGPFKRREKLKALRDELAKHPETPPTENQRQALEILDRKHVNDMTADELRDAAEAVEQATHESQFQNAFLDKRRQETVDQTTAKILDEVHASRQLPLTKPTTFRPAKRKFLTLDSPYLREWASRPEVIIKGVSPELSKLTWESLGVDAFHTFDKYMREHITGLGQAITDAGLDIGGFTVPGMPDSARSALGLMSSLEKWRNETRLIGGVEMTRGEAHHLHLLMRDRENRAALREHGAKVRDKFTGPFTPKIENEINSFVGPEGASIADWMFRQLNGPIVDRVNAAWVATRGYRLTNRKQHVPRRLDPDRFWTNDLEKMPEQIGQAVIESYRHTKQRTRATGALVVEDSIDAFTNHADRMSRIAAYMVPLRDANAVLLNPKVRDAIQAKTGKLGYDFILDKLNRQVLPPPVKTKGDAFWRGLNTGVAGGILGFRIGAHALQPLSLLTAAAHVPGGVGSVLHAYRGGREVLDETERLLEQHSPYFWHRYHSDSWAGEATGGILSGRGWFQPRPIAELSLDSLQWVEKQISLRKGRMAQDVVEQAGITPDDPAYGPAVAKEWLKMMLRSESSSNGLELNSTLAWGKDNPVFGSLVMFQNAASKAYSIIPEGYQELRAGHIDSGSRKLALGAASVLFTAMLRDLLSREEVGGDWPERVAKRAVLAAGQLLPMGGELVEPVARNLMGMKVWEDDPNATTDLIAEVVKGVGAIADAIHNEAVGTPDPEKFWRKGTKGVKALLTLMGVPVEGIDDLSTRTTEIVTGVSP